MIKTDATTQESERAGDTRAVQSERQHVVPLTIVCSEVETPTTLAKHIHNFQILGTEEPFYILRAMHACRPNNSICIC